jgi:ribonucleotide monophosphatase NagD (HAD superfamily)
MVCANPDIVVDRGETRTWCGGALADAYEKHGGDARYFGKPHRPIYDLARARIEAVTGRSIDPARILAIGDGPGTDVKGAADNGLDCLFVAGGLGAATLLDSGGAVKPDALAEYFKAHDIAPHKTLAFLR